MSRSVMLTSVRRLRSLMAAHQNQEQSDEQLLSAFAERREEIAFAALVRRHGPMVLSVCRRVLGHEQDAEDAFQATFLVLAQRAASLRNKNALASFLHGTAYHLASKAKRAAGRRRKYENSLGALRQPRSPADPAEDLLWREVRLLLDEEIARLPEKFRSVFVLCCLEELSQAEAGRLLGLKEGTVANRLAEARKRLSQRLTRRGLELTAVLTVAAVATPPASALPLELMAATIKASLAMAAGEKIASVVPAAVVDLVQSMTTALMLSKAKLATVVLLAMSLLTVAASGALVRWHGQVGGLPAVKDDDKPKAAYPKREPEKITEIQGRVVDPDDKPVKGARLYWPQFSKDLPKAEKRLEWVERGRSDDDGRFRIPLATGDDLPDSLRQLVVTADGYGLTWVELPDAKSSANVVVRMRKDVVIQGRILSLEGRPLAGVRVRVERLEEMPKGRLDDYLAYWERDWNKANQLKTRSFQLSSKQSMLPPVVTDRKGCFQLSGVGSERIVHLAIHGEGIAHAALRVVARPSFDPSALNQSARKSQGAMMRASISGPAPVLYGPTFDHVAVPARIVEGVVREAGSGKLVPGVRIHGHIQGNAGYPSNSVAITDKEGRYRLEGLPKIPKALLILEAKPLPDSPWLLSVQAKEADAGEGLQPARVDFTLGRGVVLKGRVIDRGTGKGVVSFVSFVYLPDNKYAGKPGYPGLVGLFHRTDESGRFRLKVVPGTGVLEAAAEGASNPFKPARFDAEDRKHITFAEDGDYRSFNGGPGFFNEMNAVKWLDLDPEAAVVVQNLYLERGATARVRLQDPQGNPLSGVIVSGIDALSIKHIHNAYVAPKAECTIVGLEPSRPRQVVFYHAEHRLAGTLVVRGDEKDPLTVRLAPTGAVTGRLRKADGEPIQGAEIEIAAGGPRPFSSLTCLYLHLRHTRLPARTDKEGRFRLEGVVPGEKFSLVIRRRGVFLNGGLRTIQIQVKAGETLDLGDISIKAAE